jgi:hypothetical protein
MTDTEQIFIELVALLKGHPPERLDAFQDFMDEEVEKEDDAKIAKLPTAYKRPKSE